MLIAAKGDNKRRCGGCTTCCRLLPMQKDSESRHPAAIAHSIAIGLAKPGIPDFDKAAGARCPHQRYGKGCAVHGHHPFGCQVWACRWLVGDDTADLRRPDRTGVVVDILPDFVTLDAGDGTPPQNVEAVAIWVDPKHPDAWRDPPLLEYLIRRGAEGKIGLIRFNSSDGLAVFPPNMSSDGEWHEIPRTQTTVQPQHTPGELMAGLAGCRNVMLAVPTASHLVPRSNGETQMVKPPPKINGTTMSQIRKFRGITQQQLADQIGMSLDDVIQLEGGEDAPQKQLEPGDPVWIATEERTIEGMIISMSENGHSLILGFEAILGGHAGEMPVLLDDERVYRSIITGEEVGVAPRFFVIAHPIAAPW